MKYSIQIEINLPPNKVAELLISHNNYSKWQDGFVSMKPISGETGEVGSKMKLCYQMGKREIEMVETVTEKDFPNSYATIYEAKNVWNLVRNVFKETNDNKTIIESQVEFQFKGFMKVIALLMPGVFKKQTKKNYKDFKRFAENISLKN